MRHGWEASKQHSHSKACRKRFEDIFREAPEDKHRVDEADKRQNRWLAEQIQGTDMPANGGVDELPSASAPPQSFRPPGEEEENRGTDMYVPTENEDDDDMEGFTEDMDTRSVGLVLQALDRGQSSIVEQCEREILLAIRSLGGSRKGYKRERKAALNRIVSEIYSPPRVTAAAKLLPSLRLIPGAALDLTVNQEDGNPWDFDIKANREKARDLFETQRPALVIGSVLCTAFSQIQALNAHRRDPQVIARERVRAMVHLRFVCQLYQMQLDEGRYFLHEHPAGATSWKEECVETIWRNPSVERIVNDQCQFGQEHGGEPVMKPTGWMSNSPHILQQLRKRCTGPRGICSYTGTPHRHATGKVARDAAIYPFLLCKAILLGLCKQLRGDGHLTAGSCGFTTWNET